MVLIASYEKFVEVSLQQIVPWLLPKTRSNNTRMYTASRFTFAVIRGTNLPVMKNLW